MDAVTGVGGTCCPSRQPERVRLGKWVRSDMCPRASRRGYAMWRAMFALDRGRPSVVVACSAGDGDPATSGGVWRYLGVCPLRIPNSRSLPRSPWPAIPVVPVVRGKPLPKSSFSRFGANPSSHRRPHATGRDASGRYTTAIHRSNALSPTLLVNHCVAQASTANASCQRLAMDLLG